MQLEQLGPYRIGRKLGRGGMGTVYAGVEIESGEPAAVKVLSAALAHEEGFRERFESEIESLRKLRHPNIVRIFGFGEQDDCLFYAMELVEGSSLEEELHAGRAFDWREVAEIGVQACRALKHAHDRGVVHRDIKPANLLLARDGTLKLSDFGIAKLFGNSGLTADGGVLGTAEYMAPEQADGRPVNHRCDLYSLGGVLYALLARRPPFRTSSLVEMLQLQRFAEPEPVRRFAPDTPPELEAIIGLLLEKDPERRVPTAMVLSRRLESMKHGLTALQGSSGLVAESSPADEGDFVVNATTAVAPEPNAIPDQPADEYPLSGTPPGPTVDVQRAARSDFNLASALAVAANEGQSGDAKALGVAVAPLPGKRFVPVAPEEADELPAADDQPWVSPQTWVLAASLVAVGLTLWYLLQPPSLDRLYERSVEAARKNELSRAEGDIQAFLSRAKPADPRAKKLEDYRRRIELEKLAKKIERRLKRQDRNDPLTPVERAYAEALDEAQADPEAAMVRLEALISLYQYTDNDETPITWQVLQLARDKLAQLRRDVEQYAPEHLELLRRQLDRADALADGNPQAAREMWQAVIELYDDKPWAEPAVKRARSALAGRSSARTD